MNKAQLLRRLEAIVDDFERTRAWGTIEVELRDGMATLCRKTITERLDAERERTRGQKPEYNSNH